MVGLIFEVKIGPDWSFFVADVRFGCNGADLAGLRANHIPGLGVSESQELSELVETARMICCSLEM